MVHGNLSFYLYGQPGKFHSKGVGQRSVGINSRREIVGMFLKTEKCGGNIYKPFQQMFNEKKGLGRLIQFNDFLVF